MEKKKCVITLTSDEGGITTMMENDGFIASEIHFLLSMHLFRLTSDMVSKDKVTEIPAGLAIDKHLNEKG